MPLHDNKRARLLPNATLEALDNDLLIRCASYLDVEGLVQLGRVGVQKANELAYRAAPAQKLAKLGSLAALRGVQEPGELRERLSTH